MVRFLLLPWLAYNVYVGLVFAFDKHRAVRGGRRVPEKTLLLLACAFGAVGALASMQLARHKTRKWQFSVGVPCMLVAQLVLVVLATRAP